jgi:hypothetical protein
MGGRDFARDARRATASVDGKRERLAGGVAGPAAVFLLCVLVTPTQEIHLCRDSDDDLILACPIEAGATLIITSDSDLLALSRHHDIEGIEIVGVQEARRRFVTGVGTARP